MQIYVTLVRLRDNTNASSNPSQIVQDVIKKNGGTLISAHATLGFYDLVIVAEYPTQQNAFSASTALKTQNGWITETMAAEPLVNFDKIYSEASRSAQSAPTRR